MGGERRYGRTRRPYNLRLEQTAFAPRRFSKNRFSGAKRRCSTANPLYVLDLWGPRVKIFLSYASEDEWIATQLKGNIEAAGCEVFMAKLALQTGDDCDKRILDEAREADEFVVLLSPASIKSSWVFMEVGAARVLGRRLAPLLCQVGINEVPEVFKRHQARPLNELNTYIEELTSRLTSPAEEVTLHSAVAEPMPSFAVGDWVRIVDRPTVNLAVSRQLGWVPSMSDFRGQITHVTGFSVEGAVTLAIDAGLHAWSPEWIVPSNPPPLPPLSEILIR